jgi:hypothetical protein
MPQITNLGTNSVSTAEWLNVSKELHIAPYRAGDLMSSFTTHIQPTVDGDYSSTIPPNLPFDRSNNQNRFDSSAKVVLPREFTH